MKSVNHLDNDGNEEEQIQPVTCNGPLRQAIAGNLTSEMHQRALLLGADPFRGFGLGFGISDPDA